MDAARGPAGRPGQRAALLDGIVDHLLRQGVATLSLRPLAAALGTSDRMLLYYFGTRDKLLVAALTEVGARLQTSLETALPADPVSPGLLLEDAWQALRGPEVEPVLRLYLEISGLAVRGHEPYRLVAAEVAAGWVTWVAARLDVPEDRRPEAALGVLTVIDGLLLLRFVVDPAAADAAAGWLRPLLDPR